MTLESNDLSHVEHAVMEVLRHHGEPRWYSNGDIDSLVNHVRVEQRGRNGLSSRALRKAIRRLHDRGLIEGRTVHDDGRVRHEWRRVVEG